VNSSNAVVARYLYDPYGNLLAASGPLADANLYRFSSKEFHAASGLYYYGFRFYESNLQRWMNRDPMGESFDPNLFRFNYNGPANHVDPNGENPLLISGGVGALIGGGFGVITGGVSGGWKGAISGGVGSLVSGGLVGMAVNPIAAGAAGGAVATGVSEWMKGNDPFSKVGLGQAAIGAGVGGVFGGVGGRLTSHGLDPRFGKCITGVGSGAASNAGKLGVDLIDRLTVWGGRFDEDRERLFDEIADPDRP
jgi:RHS repeat-associated protein